MIYILVKKIFRKVIGIKIEKTTRLKDHYFLMVFQSFQVLS